MSKFHSKTRKIVSRDREKAVQAAQIALRRKAREVRDKGQKHKKTMTKIGKKSVFNYLKASITVKNRVVEPQGGGELSSTASHTLIYHHLSQPQHQLRREYKY